jgi:hypothetical protein
MHIARKKIRQLVMLDEYKLKSHVEEYLTRKLLYAVVGIMLSWKVMLSCFIITLGFCVEETAVF